MVLRSCWKSRHKSGFGPVSVWMRTGCVALLWVCVFHLGCLGLVGGTKTVVQKEAEFDVTYNDTVTSDDLTIYAFNHTISRNKVSILSRMILYSTHTLNIYFGLMLDILVSLTYVSLSFSLSDWGDTCDGWRALRRSGKPYLVCGEAEAGCAVLPGAPYSERTVSIHTCLAPTKLHWDTHPGPSP